MLKAYYLERKNIRMSIEEFMQYSRNEITLKDIWGKRELEKVSQKIITHKRIIKLAVFILAGVLFVSNPVLAASADPKKIDEMGNVILGIIRSFGYWTCIFLASKDIVQSLLHGESKEVGQILLKHIVAFGGFYALPWVFNFIRDFLG